MASHHHHHHHPYHHQSPPPPTHCCCNPSFTFCTPPPSHHPAPSHDHLLQAIASLLHSQQPHLIPSHIHPNNSKSQNPKHQSTISSLLHRIETLESSLNHHTHQSLRHAAARIIQAHFRSFLVRRSKTLRHLKHLAYIKSSLASLRSSFSTHTHFDFPPLSLKAVNLLLELDSIEACDPMVVDGKRSISRDLVQFLDSIEEVAKKQVPGVKAAKNFRSGQRVQRPRNSGGDDEKKKLLKNLRGRVQKISKLCEVYGNDEEEGSEPENGFHDHDHYDDNDDGVSNVFICRRNDVSQKKNGVVVPKPRMKKSVRFAENGNIYEVFSSRSCESDGSLSNDDQGEVLENVNCAVVEDIADSSRCVGDDEEVLVVESGGSTQSSDDGEKNYRRDLKNDDRNIMRERFQEHQEKLLFSAPLIVKMENRTDLKKSKG